MKSPNESVIRFPKLKRPDPHEGWNAKVKTPFPVCSEPGFECSLRFLVAKFAPIVMLEIQADVGMDLLQGLCQFKPAKGCPQDGMPLDDSFPRCLKRPGIEFFMEFPNNLLYVQSGLVDQLAARK